MIRVAKYAIGTVRAIPYYTLLHNYLLSCNTGVMGIALSLLPKVTCGADENGAVRLVSSSSVSRGRVEVCMGGSWGTVCDNDWTDEDVFVVCRQLGYTGQGD